MTPRMVTLIGLAAAFCTTSSFVPQVYRTFKTRRTEDISLGMYVILAIGIFLWVVYGILNRDLPLILANSVSLALALCVLALKIRHG